MKIIHELAGAFVDDAISDGAYLFSYRNTRDDLFEFYKEKLKIITSTQKHVISYTSITDVTIDSSVKSSESKWLKIHIDSHDIDALIDLGLGKFRDIFTIYRFLSRRVFMANKT